MYFCTCYVTSFGKLWNRIVTKKGKSFFFMEFKASQVIINIVNDTEKVLGMLP